MVNYQDGKIYKIVSESTDKIYIGSTCQTLAKRLAKHKDNFTQFSKGKHLNNATTSFEILKYGDAKILLIELFPCSQKCELEAREYHHMKLNDNKVNKAMPTRPIQELRDANKGNKKEYDKLYYESNKEKKQEQNKIYNQEHGLEIYEKRKDYLKTYMKLKQSEIFVCECGCSTNLYNKARHMRSKKHLSYII